MPAKPIPSKKPTTTDATAMFQQLIENVKGQTASWTSYINIQGQAGDFDLFKILKTAFFMQSIATRKLFLQYNDSVKMKLLDVQKALEEHKAVLLFSAAEGKDTFASADHYVVRQFFIVEDHTAVVCSRRDYDTTDICVYTFDRKFWEESIKNILVVKE